MRLGRAGWLGLFAALGAVAAWLAMPGPAPELAPSGAPAQATLDGQPLVGADADAMTAAADALARAWLDRPLAVVVEGTRVERTREQLGARVDRAHLRSMIEQLAEAGSALRRTHAGAPDAQKPLALPMPYGLDAQAAMAQLLQIKDAFDRAPVDARYDFKTKNIAHDQPGRSVDAWGTLARLDAALASRGPSIDAVVDAVAAKRSAAQLAGVSTDSVLGWFETKYARDQKHEARTFNLRLAASRLDGYVALPGETFDFNQVVGPRNEANGYRVAPVIAQGELVDGIGGGTCQIAGTLHAASFFAGLDVEERRPHTRPSFYIKMGLDAAVAYPTITLKLKNSYPFPVVLHESVEGGVVRAEVLGPRRTRDVTFARRIDEVVPFVDRDSPDPTLPKDARELKQRGIPGFKVTRWRIVRDGSFAVREHHTDYYPPTTQIWRVGTGPEDPKFEAHDDEHPEYVADEFMTIAQGPDVTKASRAKRPDESHAANAANPAEGAPNDTGRGDMVESRVPGRTGTYGWTEREGFTKHTHGTRARGGDAESREGID